jgi:hypothetical protein
MKSYRIAALVALACIAWAMTACSTTTAPDGTKTSGADPALTAAATAVAVEAIHAYTAKREIHPAK